MNAVPIRICRTCGNNPAAHKHLRCKPCYRAAQSKGALALYHKRKTEPLIINEAGFKTCTKCGESKPVDAFYRKTARQQRNTFCIPCYQARAKIGVTQRRTCPAYRKAEYRRDANTPQHRATALYQDIARRAVKKGLEFTLTKEWIKSRLAACAVTNVPLLLVRDGSNKTNPLAPSVDRKDPAKGYTTENCQVVCWMYNAARNYHDHDDVVRFARALIRAEEEKPLMAAGAVRE